MQHRITATVRALVVIAMVMTLAACADGPGEEVLAEIGGDPSPSATGGASAEADDPSSPSATGGTSAEADDPSSPSDAGLRDELAAAGLSEATIACVLDAAADSGLDLGDLDPSASASPATAAALAPCLDDLMNEMFDQLGDEMGDAFADGFGDLFGEDGSTFDFGEPTSQVELDRLADECRAGDNGACDDLWLSSPIDSPEEQLAETCGGRSSEPRYATCELFLD